MLYKGTLDIGHGEAIPVIFRIEGCRIFVAIAGEPSYADTLITSVKL